ncbi:hypothetical protein BDAP_002755 [Binucleata daphniae]
MKIKFSIVESTIFYESYKITNTKSDESGGRICELLSFHDFIFCECDLIFYTNSVVFGLKIVGHTNFKISDLLIGKTKYYIQDKKTLGLSKWHKKEEYIGTVTIKAEIIEEEDKLTHQLAEISNKKMVVTDNIVYNTNNLDIKYLTSVADKQNKKLHKTVNNNLECERMEDVNNKSTNINKNTNHSFENNAQYTNEYINKYNKLCNTTFSDLTKSKIKFIDINKNNIENDALQNELEQKYSKIINLIYKKEYFDASHTAKGTNTANIFNFLGYDLFTKYSNYVCKLWRLFRYISKGSMSCHFFFWYGLIRLNSLYENYSNDDDIKSCYNNDDTKKSCYSNDDNTKSCYNNNDTKKSCEYEINNETQSDINNTQACNETSTKIVNYTTNMLKTTQHYKLNLKKDLQKNKSVSSTEDEKNKKIKKTTHNNLTQSDNTSFFEKYFANFFSTNSENVSCGVVNKEKDFYLNYINKYYFSIAVYTNKLLFYQIKKRKTVDNVKKNRKRILEYLNIENEDLLEINLSSKKSSVKHIMFYDKTENTIVVSFRGTQSHHDALNDIDCEYVEFYDGFAHSGILNVAKKFIKEHIELLKKCAEKRKTNKILFTGHSLGGAISAFVYILVIENLLLTNYECKAICFSSPPIVSINFCSKYKNITNIIYENDIVPRLSFGSLNDLKYLAISIGKDNLDIKKLSKISKYLIKKDLNPKLYLPGCIYHVMKDGNVYERNAIAINTIIANTTCFTDHFFCSLMNGLSCGLKSASQAESIDNETDKINKTIA